MDLKQIFVIACFVQLSYAAYPRLRDVIAYVHRGDYLKELERNNFYGCNAKVSIAFDCSTNFGKTIVLDKVRKMVRALEKELSKLNWRPKEPDLQGVDIDLVPFSDTAEVISLKTVGKTNEEVQPLIEEYFKEVHMTGKVSSFYSGFTKASKAAYVKAKRNEENAGIVIVMTNGVYPHEGDLDAEYEDNLSKGLTHFMIGYPGRDGQLKSHHIYRYADTGKYRFYWKPQNNKEIKEVAAKIADEIAGIACSKMK